MADPTAGGASRRSPVRLDDDFPFAVKAFMDTVGVMRRGRRCVDAPGDHSGGEDGARACCRLIRSRSLHAGGARRIYPPPAAIGFA